MKKILGLLFLMTIFLTGCLLYGPQPGYDNGPSSGPSSQDRPYDRTGYDDQDVSDFYAYLGPYGVWVSYVPYGDVWIPRDIEYGWRPYTRGHWVCTDDGWTWMSNERWGWLVHHYGRWGWDQSLGWFWVPGTVWGPSWVTWRWGDLYIGWAPIPPGYDFDPGFGFRRRDFDIPGHYWNFIRGIEFMNPQLDRWILPRERNITIINYTHFDSNIYVRGNRVINDGVGIDQVRRLTNQSIERHQLQDARRPGEERVDARDALVYRPELRKKESSRPKEALNRDQAAARIQRDEASGRFVRPSSQAAEESIRQVHDQERRRLEQDQQSEVQEIRRKADSDRAAVRNPAGRQKVEAAAKARITEVEKRHEAEKAQLVQRHKEEEQKIKKGQPKK
ncbi:MAG: cell envelope integrity protein TolA [Candidatus Aminicenantales bacterium]|jgi:hypothetical protein